MASGVTLSGFEFPRPEPHKYTVPPLAVKMVEVPAHIGFAEAEMPALGIGLTLIVMVAVPVHPNDVPVMVYVVVEEGVTDNGVEVPNPLLH